MTRNLAQFTAAGYMIEKGQENKALTQAETLTLDEVEAALLGVEPRNPSGGPAENGVGSYERFMMMMGQLEIRGKQM